jgi:hypothetical protein
MFDMRYLILLLCLLLLGCGDSGFDGGTTSGGFSTPLSARNRLLIGTGNDVVASIDALPPNESDLIYATVGTWSDSNVSLTGTSDQAIQAVGTVVRSPQFGAHDLYLILNRLSPDNGQGFLVTFGGTLSSGIDTAVARSEDSFEALLSQTNVVSQNVEPLIEQNLPPQISSIQEFHGLRILDPGFLPPAKREGMLAVRGTVPNAVNGELIRKIIMVSDMQSYLDGTFDPAVGGFTAIENQTDFLVTPAQYIDGLRLDYPGGFQGQTQVAALSFPQTPDFEMIIPYSAPMGGMVDQTYPFTGTGFTSNVQAQAVPEFNMPSGERTPLPVGSQIFLITESGDAQLQGTLNAQGLWTLNRQILTRQAPRQSIRRHAVYQGYPIWVNSTDGQEYWVACEGSDIPGDLFDNMRQVGPGEYLGRISVSDPELTILD